MDDQWRASERKNITDGRKNWGNNNSSPITVAHRKICVLRIVDEKFINSTKLFSVSFTVKFYNSRGIFLLATFSRASILIICCYTKHNNIKFKSNGA